MKNRFFITSLVVCFIISTANASLYIDFGTFFNGNPGEEITFNVVTSQPCTNFQIDSVSVNAVNSYQIAKIIDFNFAGSFSTQYQPYSSGVVNPEHDHISGIHGISGYPVAANSNIWFMTLQLDDDPYWVAPGSGFEIIFSGITVNGQPHPSLDISWVLVPEPATLLLFGIGALLVSKKV